jgi:hypothetical protein
MIDLRSFGNASGRFLWEAEGRNGNHHWNTLFFIADDAGGAIIAFYPF